MKSILWYFFLFAALLSQAAHAEKADIEKKVQISADKVESTRDAEGHKRVIATGHAILTKGTLTIRGDSIDATYVDKNDRHAEISVFSTGEGVTIRQKREGVDKWIEGESSSVFLNLLDDIALVALHGNAKLRQIQGAKTVDESFAGGISYDMRTDVVDVFLPAGPPANAMSASDAKAYVCTDANYVEVRNLRDLEPQVAKMMAGVSDRGGPFNPGDVGLPGTRFVIAAASKNAVLVAVERGGIGYFVYAWFFVRDGDKWKRGLDFPLSPSPPKTVGELLRGANSGFGCGKIPSIGKSGR